MLVILERNGTVATNCYSVQNTIFSYRLATFFKVTCVEFKLVTKINLFFVSGS